MFSKILIANRGEIACRVMQTARRMGVSTVAVYSDADAGALHVELADEAVHIGPAPARDSYLVASKIVDAALATGAQAIHPGYGFLSENPDFVEAVAAAGLTFIGPSASAIRAMGLKDAAKRLMEEAGVPVVPGYHGDDQDPDRLAAQAADIGFPVLIKASAGGGGKGMRRVDGPDLFADALASAQREAAAAFANAHVLIEKFVTSPRHIEVQVFGDGTRAVHLFERDCSLQRRHQKVIEEAPAPGMTEEMRASMGGAAVRAAEAIGYAGAGTVEFIVDASEGLRPDRFYFMEMNTRLQVEHPVTEAITGVDLVEWQLRVAAGEPLPSAQEDLAIDGHAFEARLYAEDAAAGFLPATGRIAHLSLPGDSARIDTGVRTGDAITPHYDPMIAKVTVHGPDRTTALKRLQGALDASEVAGTVTNLAFLCALARHAGFAAGDVDTGLIERDQAALTAAPAPGPEHWAVAALAALGIFSPPVGKDDPWAGLGGWRLWGRPHDAVRLVQDGTDSVVTIIGDPSVGAECATPSGDVVLTCGGPIDRPWIEVGGMRRGVHAVVHDQAVTVFDGSGAFQFDVPDPLAAEDDAAAGGDQVTAPMTGLVKEVAVTVGDTVAAGQRLVVMEAMKMEHTLTSPRDGVIAQLIAATGEQVGEGVVLVRLEAEDA